MRCTISRPYRADIPAQNLPFQGQLTSSFSKDGRQPSTVHPLIFQAFFKCIECMLIYVILDTPMIYISKYYLLFILTIYNGDIGMQPAKYMLLQGNRFFMMGRNHNRGILDGHAHIYRSTDHSEHYAPCFCLL